MKAQPTLETERLVLRPLLMQDDLVVRELSNNPEIRDLAIWPLSPCGRKVARRWIALTRERWADGTGVEFAIERKDGAQVLGVIGLSDIHATHASAELGFLLNPPHWGKGYATEASQAVLSFGFKKLKLNRIFARSLVRNSASAGMLTKLGMKPEGVLRQFARKDAGFEDVVLLAILRQEWEAA